MAGDGASVLPFRSWIRDRVGTISLASASNRNALSFDTLQRLQAQLRAFFCNPSVNVVVIQSDTPGTFSSSHDLRAIHRLQQEVAGGGAGGRDRPEGLFRLCSSTMLSIFHAEKPVIAKFDGVVTAAGCQLVASCELAYATGRSAFCTPCGGLGLYCSTPGVALGRSVGRKHAAEMLLTGRMVPAAEAVKMGLINRTVGGGVEELDVCVAEVARTIASKSPGAIGTGKPLFARQMDSSLDEAYALASIRMAEDIFPEAGKEGIAAFLENRTPDWRDEPVK